MALMLPYFSSGDFASRAVGLDEVIYLADHVTFEAADDVSFDLAFSGAG